MITFKVVRVGNHWYPNIKHSHPDELLLDRKIELLINILNKFNNDSFNVYLYEINSFMPERGVIEINDTDLFRYEDSEDDFNLRITIDGREFLLSSKLYTLLEDNFNLELNKTQYKIEIW